MKITNFTFSVNCRENENFETGTKLIPERTLNRFTDAIFVSVRKDIYGSNMYKLGFSKKSGGKVQKNNFELTKKEFKGYINFLLNFKETKSELFNFNTGGKVEVFYLNKNMIKIKSMGFDGKKVLSIFYIISEIEFEYYIDVLKRTYCGKKICSPDFYETDRIPDVLSKNDKNSIYREVVSVLIDGALDRRDAKLFRHLCNKFNL